MKFLTFKPRLKPVFSPRTSIRGTHRAVIEQTYNQACFAENAGKVSRAGGSLWVWQVYAG